MLVNQPEQPVFSDPLQEIHVLVVQFPPVAPMYEIVTHLRKVIEHV